MLKPGGMLLIGIMWEIDFQNLLVKIFNLDKFF